MKIVDRIIELLIHHKFQRCWFVQGGAIAHLIDAGYRRNSEFSDFECTAVQHEQAGGFAADAYSRLSPDGYGGVVMVTSGPGATNLITAISSNWYDGVPVVYITGQVRTWEQSKGNQRQKGFQETDIVSMVKGITKYATRLDNTDNIEKELLSALHAARNGRPGPVLVDLPMDVQWAPAQIGTDLTHKSLGLEDPKPDDYLINLTLDLLNKCARPCIIIGQGARANFAYKDVISFAEKFHIPVVTGFAAKDLLHFNSPVNVGMIGTMGTGSGNRAVQMADLVIVCGARLSWRQVRSSPDSFAKQAKLVHIDLSASELNANVKADVAIQSSVTNFVLCLKDKNNLGNRSFSEYLNYLKKSNDIVPNIDLLNKPKSTNEGYNPYCFLKALSDVASDEAWFVLDTGQNLVWSIQSLESKGARRFVSSWGHSPMGYSIGAVLGAEAASNGKNEVICIIGDGGLQMNIQEFQTIAHYQLKIKVIVMNNNALGAIKEFQDDNLSSRHFGTSSEHGYSAPDIKNIASAYGLSSRKLTPQSNDLQGEIDEFLKSSEVVLEVPILEEAKMHLSLLNYS